LAALVSINVVFLLVESITRQYSGIMSLRAMVSITIESVDMGQKGTKEMLFQFAACLATTVPLQGMSTVSVLLEGIFS
jgi:hypothetical protein